MQKEFYCNDYVTFINSEFTSIGFINGITKYPFHYVYHIEDSFINNRLVLAFEHPRYLKFSWQFVEVVYKCQTKWAAKLWWTEIKQVSALQWPWLLVEPDDENLLVHNKGFKHILYILVNKRNDTKIFFKYIFMLKLKQLFIIIYVNVCVKRVYLSQNKQ
jgi:hypothetical protein